MFKVFISYFLILALFSCNFVTPLDLQKSTLRKVDITMNLKFFLSGPYNISTDEMDTSLSAQSLIPDNQPYVISPFNYNGEEVVQTDLSDIVDWVLIELVDDTNSRYRVAGLLSKTGEVLGSDGGSLNIEVPEGEYYLVIRHRNHLSVATKEVFNFENEKSTLEKDFTLGNLELEEGLLSSNAQDEVEAGVFALWGGDLDQDGLVGDSDLNIITSENSLTGYLVSDIDTNGSSNASDIVNYLFSSLNKASSKKALLSFDRVLINIKLFLASSYNTSTDQMDTKLWKTTPSFSSVIPNNQPYNVSPFNYNGTETKTTGSEQAKKAVDWVLVELWNDYDPNSVVLKKSFLLDELGALKDSSGTSPIDKPIADGVKEGSYYLVIRHRNHLPIISANKIEFSRFTELQDFTSDLSLAKVPDATNDAMKEVESGVYALWGGDANQDGEVEYNLSNSTSDSSVLEDYLLAQTGSSTGVVTSTYHPMDINMDGDIDSTGGTDDKSSILTSVGVITNIIEADSLLRYP